MQLPPPRKLSYLSANSMGLLSGRCGRTHTLSGRPAFECKWFWPQPSFIFAQQPSEFPHPTQTTLAAYLASRAHGTPSCSQTTGRVQKHRARMISIRLPVRFSGPLLNTGLPHPRNHRYRSQRRGVSQRDNRRRVASRSVGSFARWSFSIACAIPLNAIDRSRLMVVTAVSHCIAESRIVLPQMYPNTDLNRMAHVQRHGSIAVAPITQLTR
jgi:hypothetical protein